MDNIPKQAGLGDLYFALQRVRGILEDASSLLPRVNKAIENLESLLHQQLTGGWMQLNWSTGTPIEQFEFSTRTYVCLKKGGYNYRTGKDVPQVNTLGDLLACTEKDLKMIRGLGRKSLYEILERLSLLGLELAKEPGCDLLEDDRDPSWDSANLDDSLFQEENCFYGSR